MNKFEQEITELLADHKRGRDNLRVLERLSREETASPFFSVKTDDGVALQGLFNAISLYNDGNIAISRADFPEGSEYPIHTHDEKEVIFVVTGSMTLVCTTTDDRDMESGECCYIAPFVPHGIEFHTPTTLISVTMPASPHYPQ